MFLCGRRSGASLKIELPRIVFGYIVDQIAYIEALRPNSKSEMTITAGDSELLGMILLHFDKDVSAFAIEHLGNETTPRNKAPNARRNSLVRPAPHARLFFNMNEEEWKEFLRRLDLDVSDEGNDKDIPF